MGPVLTGSQWKCPQLSCCVLGHRGSLLARASAMGFRRQRGHLSAWSSAVPPGQGPSRPASCLGSHLWAAEACLGLFSPSLPRWGCSGLQPCSGAATPSHHRCQKPLYKGKSTWVGRNLCKKKKKSLLENTFVMVQMCRLRWFPRGCFRLCSLPLLPPSLSLSLSCRGGALSLCGESHQVSVAAAEDGLAWVAASLCRPGGGCPGWGISGECHPGGSRLRDSAASQSQYKPELSLRVLQDQRENRAA